VTSAKTDGQNDVHALLMDMGLARDGTLVPSSTNRRRSLVQSACLGSVSFTQRRV